MVTEYTKLQFQKYQEVNTKFSIGFIIFSLRR
jgi:hypothetical protein